MTKDFPGEGLRAPHVVFTDGSWLEKKDHNMNEKRKRGQMSSQMNSAGLRWQNRSCSKQARKCSMREDCRAEVVDVCPCGKLAAVHKVCSPRAYM